MRIETWKDGELINVIETPDVIAVPQRVEMAQARLALLQGGHLETVNAAMFSMPKAAQIEWEFRSHVARRSPLVEAMIQLLGLSEQQADDLFILAATL